MNDYQKYINALKKCAKEHENDRTFTGHIIVADLCRDTANLLEELEQEPKTGYREYNDIYDHYLCGNCKTVVMDYDNFCPNCGADMRGKQHDGM